MDCQGSVYYYYGYSSFMKGKGRFEGESLAANSESQQEWFKGYSDAMADHRARNKREMGNESYQLDNSSQQLENLAQKPVAPWCGDGMPPVGCICEAAQPGQIEWDAFKVIAVNSGAVFGFWDNGVASALDGDCWKFRPIRNNEELKREEACSAIKSIIVKFDLESVEHRGDEMDIAKEIFFSIRAGKIPHIKLDAADE